LIKDHIEPVDALAVAALSDPSWRLTRSHYRMLELDLPSEPLPPSSIEPVRIRPAIPGDQHALFELVKLLARYERLEPAVTGSAEALGQHLFGERPSVEALLAEQGTDAVGFAVFFGTYSTFLTRPGIHLEDLFVRESHRGRGLGRALLAEVRRIAEKRGVGRLEWNVLDWNAPAIAFYERAGATIFPEWRLCRLELA
jgi:GNAT superfamily N-acetyltransferase